MKAIYEYLSTKVKTTLVNNIPYDITNKTVFTQGEINKIVDFCNTQMNIVSPKIITNKPFKMFNSKDPEYQRNWIILYFNDDYETNDECNCICFCKNRSMNASQERYFGKYIYSATGWLPKYSKGACFGWENSASLEPVLNAIKKQYNDFVDKGILK